MLWREMQWPGSLLGMWNDLGRIRRAMDRMWEASPATAPDFPAVNVFNGDEAATVVLEVPGLAAADLDVSVVGDALTVSGQRREEQPGEAARYLRRERGFGEFTRTIQLPFRADPESVAAQLAAGMLTITIGKKHADRRRRIEVTTG